MQYLFNLLIPEFGKKLIRMCGLSLGPLDRDPVKVDMGDPKQTLLMAVGPDNRYEMIILVFFGGGEVKDLLLPISTQTFMFEAPRLDSDDDITP